MLTMYAKVLQLLRSQGVQQSGLTIVGNTLATAISALALILISRLLGPTKFGEFSVGFAIVLMAVRLIDGGLNATIHKFATAQAGTKAANAIFSFTTMVKIVIFLAVAVVGTLLTPVLSSALSFNQPIIIVVAFLCSFATVGYEQLLTMLQATHRFKQAVIINIIQAGTKLLIIGLLVLTSLRDTTLIFSAYALAPLAPLFFARSLLPNWVSFVSTTWKSATSLKVFSMAKHSSIAFISAGIIENMDVLFVQKYLNSYETGLYSGASRISMVLVLVAYSLGNVLFPRVARYQQRHNLEPYIKKALLFSGVALVGIFAFVPFAQLAIQLTIGSEYLSATTILNVLMASSFFTLAAMPFIALFYSFDRPEYFSISGILQLVIMVIGNVLLVPLYGLPAAAWVRFATRLTLLITTISWGLWQYHRLYVKK